MQVNLNQGLRDVGSLWCETPLGFGGCKKAHPGIVWPQPAKPGDGI
jgi:hypothetical protein